MNWNKRFLLVGICFLLGASSATAQSFVAVTDTAAIKTSIANATAGLKSIKSDFTQEKNLSMLAEKITSRGVFYYKQDKVRLEYTQPFKYLMVINNGKIRIQDDAKTTQIDMHKNRLFQEINNIIIGCVSGSIMGGADFKVKFFSSSSQVKMEMIPVSKGLREYFSSINIFFQKTDYTVARIEMNESSGDNTIISFNNKVINGALADNLFAVN